jgi:glycerophosphoryl diester phosphodiesterase
VRTRLLVSCLALGLACGPLAAPASGADLLPDTWQLEGYVAHAFGTASGGLPYSNSFEAFERSYANGFRTFEVDLVRLKDGTVFLSHDGNEHNWGLPEGMSFKEATAKDLRGRKLRDRYPARFGSDLLRLIDAHPDCTFVLDTKWDHVEIVRWLVANAQAASRARMVPHVYSASQIRALRKTYRFPSMIIATYRWPEAWIGRTTVELAKAFKIDTVMIRERHYTWDLHVRFLQAGIRFVYVHDVVEPKRVRYWRARQIGVYSHGYIRWPL